MKIGNIKVSIQNLEKTNVPNRPYVFDVVWGGWRIQRCSMLIKDGNEYIFGPTFNHNGKAMNYSNPCRKIQTALIPLVKAAASEILEDLQD